jgi:hypothetical protein
VVEVPSKKTRRSQRVPGNQSGCSTGFFILSPATIRFKSAARPFVTDGCFVPIADSAAAAESISHGFGRGFAASHHDRFIAVTVAGGSACGTFHQSWTHIFQH